MGTSATRSSGAAAVAGGSTGTRVRLSRRSATVAAPPSTEARTSATVSASKPSRFSIVPSTRSTFQPGRVSPSGFTTPWNSCTRPSQLTNVPAVSVNGEIGSRMSAYALPCANGLITTTRSAFSSAPRAATALAKSNSASACSSMYALRGSASIACTFMPPVCGCAPATCAPTVFAASLRKPSVAPVVCASSCASAWICAASRCCTA